VGAEGGISQWFDFNIVIQDLGGSFDFPSPCSQPQAAIVAHSVSVSSRAGVQVDRE